MTTLLEPAVYTKPLSLSVDEDDLELHRSNCLPQKTTARLRELVPLLDVVGCEVIEISAERTVLSLPLIAEAMNQNGTHQAAVFYLVADYTLGVGMFGVLPGCYVTGIHDRCAALPVQYWLKQGTVHHLAPGTGPLQAEVRISPGDARMMRCSLIEKGRAELSGIVRFYQQGQLVAEAHHVMGIYADVPRAVGERVRAYQVEHMKTSALMIAGLREDPVSDRIAGDQGRAIAKRMSVATPQLPTLVRARSIDVEKVLESGGDAFRQVLVLGVGFDPKPVRFSKATQPWFGVDLRSMLREREHRLAIADAQARNFIPVVGDMLTAQWSESLLAAGFDPAVPTLIIMEGLSMYFPREVLAGVLGRIATLARSPHTRLWMDHVSPSIFLDESPEVKSFFSSMARLGEPFVTGFEHPSELGVTEWQLTTATTAADVLNLEDPVHASYRFSLLEPAKGEGSLAH